MKRSQPRFPQAPRHRRIVNRPEQALQIAVAQFLDKALPVDAVFFAVPNGFKRSKAEAGIAKAMGQRAGIPDLCIVWQGRAFFIELKAPDSGRTTPSQEETIPALAAAGASVVICDRIEAVEIALLRWEFPLRARLMAGGGIEQIDMPVRHRPVIGRRVA